MIYSSNQGGKIGYSSSKVSSTEKKLFTPIQISPPLISETIYHKEISHPNTPIPKRRKSKKSKEKNIRTQKQNRSSKEVLSRSKSRQLTKTLHLFNENFDSLVNTIKSNKKFTIELNKSIDQEKLIRAQK